MKRIRSMALVMGMLSGIAAAQECGPSCPVCSGNSDGALLARNSLLVSVMVIPTSEDEQGVVNVRYGILPWLDAGIGYAMITNRVLWNLRVQPLLEKENGWRPGIILGAGSVRVGGSDQSVYVQLTKSWEFSENVALRVNTSAATLIPGPNSVFGLCGITTSLFERFSVFANFDGRRFHEGASWIPLDWLTASALLVESKYPAASVAFKWMFFQRNKIEEKSDI
jgi:hypothetical protein